MLLEQQKWPEEGWDDQAIEMLLSEFALMDSNNFMGVQPPPPYPHQPTRPCPRPSSTNPNAAVAWQRSNVSAAAVPA